MALRKSCARLNRVSSSTSSWTLTPRRTLCERIRPPTIYEVQRPAGIMSMLRLPIRDNSNGLDACFVGIPLDSGTSNRPGTRFGPRHIRNQSNLMQFKNQITGVDPFDWMNVADCGDVHLNQYNVIEAVDQITDRYRDLIKDGCVPMTMGGEHTISYPILRAIKEKYGPVGLVHIDAHLDTAPHMQGQKIGHATTFFRAFKEDCIDSNRVFQIGIRGSATTKGELDWSRDNGWNVITGPECWNKSMVNVMSQVRRVMKDGPVYVSYDIDSIDPSYCPGTGTPEIAGLTTVQAMEIIQGLQGLNIVGCDLVEVSPPYDHAELTSFTAAHLLYEMLCVLPKVKQPNQHRSQPLGQSQSSVDGGDLVETVRS